jgi:hypothetical protein
VSRGTPGWHRRLAIAATLAALVGLAAAPGAIAKKKGSGKLRTATASTTVSGAFSLASATARCPAGTRVLGGGYTTSVPSPPSHWLDVYESRRAGARGWRVSGSEYFAGSDTLRAYAYCAAIRAKIRARSKRVAIPATADATTVVQALCPKRNIAFSGGFSTEPANATDSSFITGSVGAGKTRWVVDATRLTGVAGRSLSAYAYCAPRAKLRTRFEDAAVVAPLGSTHTATSPRCPKGSGLTGGGFATSTPVGGLLNSALVYETRRAGSRWSASATPSSAATSITLVTNAYCRG